MLQSKLLWWLFNLTLASCNCSTERKKSGFQSSNHFYKISKQLIRAKQINEASGLIKSKKDTTFWTHNDGGGKAEIYEINRQGILISMLSFPTLQNQDWEEITRDDYNNLYIGDFGNNENTRKDLAIYKVKEQKSPTIETIKFHYGDQKQYPPALEHKNFDSEAMFALGDSLFIFSKNRGNKKVKLYSVANKMGNYELMPKDSVYLKTMVTGAAISPNKKVFALLTYGKVFFFKIENQRVNFKSPQQCFKFAHQQTESIVFVTDNQLLIGNEQGQLFNIQIKAL